MSGIEGRRLRLLLVGGTVALTALHLWIARDVSLPRRGPGDQWGYVGNARFLAGDPHTYVLPYFPYFSYGYSLVLAPLIRVFHDPADLFVAIKVLNAALAASVLPLLHLFGRCVLRASRTPALAGAAVGSLVPPLVAHPSSILAENLVLPLAVATVLACWLFLTERPAWQRLLFAPAMVWLHISHNRFAVALPLFFLLLVVATRNGLAPRRLALANAGLAVTLLVVAQVVRDRIVELRWVDGIETPQGPAADALEVLRSRHLAQEYLLEAVGQAWYLAVGTLGLAAIGIWAVGRHVLPERADACPAARAGSLARMLRDPQRLTALFLLAAATGVFATSTYFFTRVANGSEGFVAGRHNDSFVPMWVAAGTVLLVAERSAARLRTLALGTAGLVAALTAVLLLGRDDRAFEMAYSMLNVPAVVHHAVAGDSVIPGATTVALGSLLVLAVVAYLGRRPAMLLPLACAWLVWSVGSEVQPDDGLDGWTMREQVARLDVRRASVVQTRFGGMPVYYLYFLPSLTAVPWDGTGDPSEPFVFAPLDAGLAERGGRVALVDEPIPRPLSDGYALALWVMPGAEQDRLVAAGALLPVGFPVALPDEARAVELEVPGGEVTEVDPGGSARVRVRGRHAGMGSPWPDEGSAGADGSVRLSTRPGAGAGGGPQPAPQHAELPGWLRPGDAFEVVVTLVAADADGRPLPPGRYEVAVDLEQRGFGSFSPPGDEPLVLVLEVR